MKTQNMRIIAVCVIWIFLSCIVVKAQNQSPSMKAWQELLDKPGLAEYFTDIFINLGVNIEETQEQFTVHHKGDHFTLSEGINEAEVDYVVNIKLQNVKNMATHGEDAEISSEESYKILSVMFTPLTAASLKSPMMSRPLMRRLAGIENHIHVYLMSPNEKEMNAHTLIFINKKWIVIEGIYGDAPRVFKMTPEQALAYQKHVFKAIHVNKTKEWRKFKKWYLNWRKEVSVET